MNDVYHHYRKLLGGSWMGEAICWTVVVPHDGRPLTLAEIGERVSGGEGYKAYGPEVFEYGEEGVEYSDDFEWAMLVDHSGPVTAILENNGFKGVYDPVLPRLSVGGRAYSAYWNVNGTNRLSFAADGEMVLSFDSMYFDESMDLSRWPELLTMAPDFDWRKGKSWRAAMLAAIEMATGARLTEEWVGAGRSFLTSPEAVLDLSED
ncbi:DUF6461 domain-containing protein [Herbidospora sp. NBRC 101105]|uniref:DUF6461 domain-containing protein n=1 Tax=Herbidospora sp. NBRC 101105 TaxID=3032195 RepID=UPI0024A563A4|nr:DUF6461 domain-containing protein [Herbidospora sp. NBRC 101105]GLX96555.1 hypothetical protein Hesp01_45050 [Herbidospora sp. NBRC 101105]